MSGLSKGISKPANLRAKIGAVPRQNPRKRPGHVADKRNNAGDARAGMPAGPDARLGFWLKKAEYDWSIETFTASTIAGGKPESAAESVMGTSFQQKAWECKAFSPDVI